MKPGRVQLLYGVACVALALAFAAPVAAQSVARFRRGDINADGALDASDSVSLLSYLFLKTAAPVCMDAADSNDDGRIDMSDAVYILQYLLGGGRAPRAPWPGCGADPSSDPLECQAYELTARSPCSDSASDGTPDSIAVSLHFLTNQERAKNGLPPLKHNPLLARAMMGHLFDMAQNDFFSHTSLDGRQLTDRVDATGYRWQSLGENISAGYLAPETAVAGWLGSPSHRANLLSPKFREMGVGHVLNTSSTYDHYWGQDFGTQSTVFPVVISLEAPSTRTASVSLYIYGEGWAAEMQISNDSSFTGANWQPYGANLGWTLKPGAGTKTVFVKLRKGTEVRAAQDSILLE